MFNLKTELKVIATGIILMIFGAVTAEAEITHEEYLATWNAVAEAGIKVYESNDPSLMGWFEPDTGRIFINSSLNYKDAKETFMHEAVHVAQYCYGGYKEFRTLLPESTVNEVASWGVKTWVANNYDIEWYSIELEAEAYALGEFQYARGGLNKVVDYYCN